MAITFADTHAHLYAEQFNSDRHIIIQKAINADVRYLFLPNIDSTTTPLLHDLITDYSRQCFGMMGLHPCHVQPHTYLQEIEKVKKLLFEKPYPYVAVGEIGIDLYWDKTTFLLQKEVFIQQLQWAKVLNLPVSVHCRESFNEVMECIEHVQDGSLRGIIHCFTGNIQEAQRVINAGFMIGIGGVITFKKSQSLRDAVAQTPLENIVLETDSPYLAPEPYRGKRNEPSYIPIIAATVARIKNYTITEVALQTTQNALRIFSVSC
ncbi:MAG: TatD family hydrolase [Bacteroidia bacterium]|nr:TatD family hydrolase [Bacteroidia bacterium]MDW8347503.1 TatD family hydrolase [Bacteroidia bacterium]